MNGFRKYRRKPDVEPGHKTIIVAMVFDKPAPLEGPLVQCYTVDRIPFMMRRTRLEQVYEPSEETSPT